MLWKKYKEAADLLYEKENYTAAFVLYFKALVGLIDQKIYEMRGTYPRNHTERFRILRFRFPSMLTELEDLFENYRNTYRKETSKEECDKIKGVIGNVERTWRNS